MKRKWVALNEAEWHIVLYALNELRTNLISEERSTDVVEEVALKILSTPLNKVDIA